MTRNRDGGIGQRGPGAAKQVLASILAALPVANLYAATGLVSTIGNAALPPPGSMPVSLTVSVLLGGLHPGATQGALECGAVAQTKAWVDAHRDNLVDYDGVYRWVLGPAHYYGNKAILQFPVASGSYVGTLTYTTALSAGALIDSSTRAPFAPNPSVLVSCWLQINGRPAVWDQGTGLQVVSSSNFASVHQKPLVVAVAEAGAGAPVNATGQLNAQGLYFSPAPVALVANLEINGPNVSAADLATNGSGPRAHTSASKQTTAPSLPPTPAELAAAAAAAQAKADAAKQAATIAAVVGVFVQEVEAVIAALLRSGYVTTPEEQKELTQTAELGTIEAVAAITSAVVSVIQEMPTLMQVYPDVVIDQSFRSTHGLLPAQDYQLTPQQVQQVILNIPTVDASASRFSDDVKALLRKIKTRS